MTAEFSSPIPVGAAQPSPILPLTKYAPVTGNVGNNKNNWLFGGINSYPSPFRSFYQHQVVLNLDHLKITKVALGLL